MSRALRPLTLLLGLSLLLNLAVVAGVIALAVGTEPPSMLPIG